jgi:hypothetical protein
MADGLFRSLPMTPAQRHGLCRKAKADRMAFESAEALAENRADPAAALARDAIQLVGAERAAWWLRHYAVAQFQMKAVAADAFLRSVTPGGEVALAG